MVKAMPHVELVGGGGRGEREVEGGVLHRKYIDHNTQHM